MLNFTQKELHRIEVMAVLKIAVLVIIAVPCIRFNYIYLFNIISRPYKLDENQIRNIQYEQVEVKDYRVYNYYTHFESAEYYSYKLHHFFLFDFESIVDTYHGIHVQEEMASPLYGVTSKRDYFESYFYIINRNGRNFIVRLKAKKNPEELKSIVVGFIRPLDSEIYDMVSEEFNNLTIEKGFYIDAAIGYQKEFCVLLCISIAFVVLSLKGIVSSLLGAINYKRTGFVKSLLMIDDDFERISKFLDKEMVNKKTAIIFIENIIETDSFIIKRYFFSAKVEYKNKPIPPSLTL